MGRTYSTYKRNEATKALYHQEPVFKKTDLKTLRNENQNWSVPLPVALAFPASSHAVYWLLLLNHNTSMGMSQRKAKVEAIMSIWRVVTEFHLPFQDKGTSFLSVGLFPLLSVGKVQIIHWAQRNEKLKELSFFSFKQPLLIFYFFLFLFSRWRQKRDINVIFACKRLKKQNLKTFVKTRRKMIHSTVLRCALRNIWKLFHWGICYLNCYSGNRQL